MTQESLEDIFLRVAKAVDGAVLVPHALRAEPALVGAGSLYVLAVGKVAFPMFQGLCSTLGPERISGGLVIAPATRFPTDPVLPAGVRALVSDHPEPSTRSVMAGQAALDFVSSLEPTARLLVLLSGGGSAAMVLPASGLSLEDKRVTTRAVARAGATIIELNSVRKHLSQIKGGRLGLACRAPVTVLAMSDVVGNDPGTIASGPFSADASTYAAALDVVKRLAPTAPAAVLERLKRGAKGELEETPKQGLAHVQYRLIASPETVVAEARTAAATLFLDQEPLSHNSEDNVETLAAFYAQRAKEALRDCQVGQRLLLLGNGEPTIVVSGNGRGGRSTHLALLLAKHISGLEHVSFLAAGTDDRDGSSAASGAIVDGSTWQRALDLGLAPEQALLEHDSETPLAALGALVRGPGSSNLLDLHLLAVERRN